MAAVRSTAEYESQLLADETRRLETSAPRRWAKFADDVGRVQVPRQRGRAGGEIALARDVEERRAAAVRRHFVGVDQLRDGGQRHGLAGDSVKARALLVVPRSMPMQ
jgi:hypothetical protein